MPSTPEAIGEILKFVPKNPRRELEVGLGDVDQDISLVYGIYPYQQRLVGISGEPSTGGWTRQPVLALELKGKDGQVTARHPLAYAADVRALGPDLVQKVADRLAVIRERPRL